MGLASSSVPADTYSPEQLIVGGNVKTLSKVFKSGTNFAANTVLAAVLVATAASVAIAGTGNGTLTMDVTTPVSGEAKNGVYRVRCITAAANGGTFRVFNPENAAIGDVAVGATFDQDIKFVIADGATDFVVGDGFDVTITGTQKFVKAVRTAQDGSQFPCAIACEDTDATSEDVTGPAYVSGEFAMQGLVWDASYSTDAHKLAAFPIGSSILIKKLGHSGG